MPRKQRKLLGRYIVADPEICHGKPTFIGTRIMVWQVLEMVAEGMPWDKITAEWRGDVTKEAIVEALQLARRAFEDHAVEDALEPQDDWERRLRGSAKDCGVSIPDSALSSEGLYE
jgi:uncharacterized protein (DUF433 family)